MRGRRLFWKLLLAFSVTGALTCVAAWFVLLTGLCSSPRTPVPETQHLHTYNCHGMTVYLSDLQETLLHWLVPAGTIFGLLAMLSALMVLAIVKVRIEVKVHHKEGRVS